MPRLEKYREPKKGKGVGYKGAKRMISWDIANDIEQQVPEFDTFIDAFGGGGSMTAEFAMREKKVIYNDFDNSTYRAVKLAMTGEVMPFDLLMGRKKFLETRDKKRNGERLTDVEELGLIINSFGNSRSSYIYAEEDSKKKYLKSLATIKKWDRFECGFAYKSIDGERLNEQVTRINAIGLLREVDELKKVEFFNLDYKELIKKQRSPKAVLYCDIPYRGTSGYDVQFDHDEFFDFIEKEVPNFAGVFVSSYSEPKYTVVNKYNKKENLSSGNFLSSETEKLYMIGVVDDQIKGQLRLF